MARFYATKNIEKIFTLWAEYRQGRTIDAEAFKKVMPLLPLASMVSEDELQGKWAALMESFVTEDNCLPSFGQTLSQLPPEEVRYLGRLWEAVLNRNDDYVVSLQYRFGRKPLSYNNLLQVFNPDINAGVSPLERKLFSGQFTDEQKANYDRLGHAMLVIEDLIRLGIIDEDQVAEQTPPKTRPVYSFSEYGVYFMKAVTLKGDEETRDSLKQNLY
jgi:hypothetical protein